MRFLKIVFTLIVLLLAGGILFFFFGAGKMVDRQRNAAAPVDSREVSAEARALHDSLLVADLHADEALRAAFDRLNPPGMAVSDFHNTSGWLRAGVPVE